MPIDRGRNAGITGTLIDIEGTPAFYLDVAAWEVTQGVQSLPVPGRGDATPWVPTISIQPGGTVVVSGEAKFAQPPTPADFQGRLGTITETFHRTGKYVTPVRIDRAAIAIVKLTQDEWKITLTGTVTGFPTISGFTASAPEATGPGAIEKELFSGLGKTKDPRNLTDAGTRFFIVRPLANTDAAENSKITDLITGAIEPFAGAKVKFARLEPSRMYDAAFFTVQFSHTDSEEDVVNPITQETLDPDGIGNSTTIAEINTTPNVPAGFSDEGVTEREIHDTAELRIRQAGVRTRKQGIEQDGTSSNEDEYSIVDDGRVTKVTDTSALPTEPTIAGHELLAVISQQFQTTPEKWRHTFLFGNTNTRDRILFPDSPIEVDPSELTDKDQKAEFNTSSTPPATPTPRVADLQLRRRVSVRVTGTPEQWKHTFYFSRNTEEDEVEIQGANQTADPNDLDETAVIRRVTNNEVPPSPPSAPVGQLIETTTEPLTVVSGAYTGRWVHTFRYGPTTRLQKIEFDGDLIVDPSNIKDADVQPVVNNNSTPPATPSPRTADLKLVRRRSRRIQGTPEKWVHVFEFARNTSEDELEHKKRTEDPDNFEETERIPIVHTSETSSPGTPSQIGTTSNLIQTEVERLCVPSGGFTGLWLWTFIFGPNTRKQDIEQEGDLGVDPALLEDDDVQTLTSSSIANPGTPSARVSGQVLMKRVVRRIQNTPEKWRHSYIFGYRTTAEKLEADRTKSSTDPDDLETERFTADVYATASPPADPGPPVAGLKLDGKQDISTNNPAYTLRVYHWRKTTSAERIVNDNTFTEEDPQGLESRQQKANINIAPTLDGGYVERATRTKELNDDNVLYTVEGGVRSTKQDIEFLQSRAIVEDGQLERRPVTVEVTASSSPGSGTNPDSTNLSLQTATSHRHTASGFYVHVFQWAPLTTTEEMDADATLATIDPGTVPLGSKYQECIVDAVATTTAAPVVVGFVCFQEEIRRVGKAKYRHVYHYRYRSNEDDLIADKTQTSTDPQGLESTAVTADVWLVSGGAPVDPLAPALPLGLKLVDKTDFEIQNPLYRIRVYKWALTDSKDAIELPGSILRYTPFTNISRRVTTVEASTDSLVTIGEAMRTTHKSDVTVDAFEVQRLNAAYVKKIVEYIASYQNLKLRVYGGWNYYPTRFTGANVQVYVSQVVSRGDGLYEVLLTEQMQWCSKIDFTITQRRNLTNVRTFFEKIGTRNNDIFIGIAAGYVTYLGGEPETERSFDAPHVMAERFSFRFDSRGLYEATGVSMGWFTTDVSVSVGWVDADTFGWGGFGLPGADYSDFLA